MLKHIVKLIAASTLCVCSALCQDIVSPESADSPASTEQHNAVQPESKRVLWIIPNHRTAPSLSDFRPLTTAEKFTIATKDALDPGTFALAGLFAAEGQMTNSNRPFGQGAAGYAKYFGAAYGDLAIGDYMTEAVFPSLFHQDPRYFRQGSGTGWSRLRYAVSQIFLTHGDSGKTQINFSELIGNATAVAISTSYYSGNRTASDATSKLGLQLGVDMAANIVKEFWPEIQRMLMHKHHPPDHAPQDDYR